MKVVYAINKDEVDLTDRDIEKGIMEFENSAHFVDNVKPLTGKFRWLPDRMLRGFHPLAWVYNWKNEREPFYVLNWKQIHPAKKCRDNDLQFESEKNYDMDATKFKHMVHLRMTDNLVTSEGFKLTKKTIVLILGIIAGAVVAYYLFMGPK